MSGISSFFGKPGKSGGASRVSRFEAASKGKTKEDKRRLEATLLPPEEIPPYTGPQPTPDAKHPLNARSVKFTFHRAEDMALFKKHFRVSKFVELSVADPGFLLRILAALETGELTYDKEQDAFTTTSRR